MDSYETLEVSRNTSISEIKKTFRTKVKKCHPDKGGNTKAFILLIQAYKKIIKEKEKEKETQPNFTKMFFTVFNTKTFSNKQHWVL